MEKELKSTFTIYKGFDIERITDGKEDWYYVYDESGCPVSRAFKSLEETQAFVDGWA